MPIIAAPGGAEQYPVRSREFGFCSDCTGTVRDLRTPQQGVHNWCPSDAKPRATFTSEIRGVRALGLLHVLLATAYKINNQLSSSAVVERCHRRERLRTGG